MAWEVEFTDEFDAWWQTISSDEQERVRATVEILAERGPGLGRPLVDTLSRSRHSQMKELRPPSGHIRVLFAFDPRRIAILLMGGDKSGQWAAWYERAISATDDLYDDHLAQLCKEGEI